MSPSSPIVVLDSGLGGLTVVRALRATLPREDILYFGDTARLPYGSKTAATVTTFVRQIIQYLLPRNPKHVLIACNTATALALPSIRSEFPNLPVSGVIEPGAKAAVVAAGAKPIPVIGVIATEATIRSRAYERAIHRRRSHVRLLLRPTPLLVPIIEEGRRDGDPVAALAIRQYLEPMLRNHMDVLVLGCTHYPVLKDLIARTAGSGIKVIDSAEQCAQDVAHRLRGRGMLRPPVAADESSGDIGALHTFVTDDPTRFKKLASRLLGVDIEMPTWVQPDDLYQDHRPEPVRISVPA